MFQLQNPASERYKSSSPYFLCLETWFTALSCIFLFIKQTVLLLKINKIDFSELVNKQKCKQCRNVLGFFFFLKYPGPPGKL